MIEGHNRPGTAVYNPSVRSHGIVSRIFYIVLTIAILVGLGLATMYSMGWLRKETADFRGGVAATEQIHANSAYRIAAYDKFFDDCAAIQGKEAQLAALRTEQATATGQRAEIVAATITGVTAARATQIAQYNADAAKSDTAANFLSSSLPFYIESTKEHTTCA